METRSSSKCFPRFFLFFCIVIPGNIHIGHLIKSVFDESGLSVSELARRISVERTTVYSIFERSSVDVIQLVRISVALNHNFLFDIESSCEMTTGRASFTFHFDTLSPEAAMHLSQWMEDQK